MTLGQGTVTIQLDVANAPCTVNSFAFLTGKKFYDNTVCHRLTDELLQCGDPTGTGTGGPGYGFANENVPPASLPGSSEDAQPGTVQYPAGTVGMAHSAESDSNGSQFFLCFKAARFPADYPIFGVVTGGLDVLTKIGEVGNDGGLEGAGGQPNEEVKITSLTVS